MNIIRAVARLSPKAITKPSMRQTPLKAAMASTPRPWASHRKPAHTDTPPGRTVGGRACLRAGMLASAGPRPRAPTRRDAAMALKEYELTRPSDKQVFTMLLSEEDRARYEQAKWSPRLTKTTK